MSKEHEIEKYLPEEITATKVSENEPCEISILYDQLNVECQFFNINSIEQTSNIHKMVDAAFSVIKNDVYQKRGLIINRENVIIIAKQHVYNILQADYEAMPDIINNSSDFIIHCVAYHC